MKKIIALLFTIILFTNALGQTDKNGNPIFNSVSKNEISVGNSLLIGNYYTLKNNIENKLSSVFVDENPSLNQIELAATNLPSEFFILTKESHMVVMIVLQHSPERNFMVMEMKTNKQSVYPCNLEGDITEYRANEIIDNKYDSTSTIKNNKLLFNEKELEIISNKEIEKAVLNLIKNEKLDKKKPSDIFLASNSQIKSYIVSASKEGGDLDFFTEIKGKEYDAVQIKQGVFTTNQGIALYKWGRACYEIGLNEVDDAYETYSEFKGKEINQRDKEYIKMGFFKELEK
ncbi:hypothetical protein [Brumimicrobium mesophilum]|uniref:hypothetical protein n=1 Tax=Brumimicrobium mesophilum TaxID=392717 RepID=UPI000D142CD6|nr:hypothetical protein [Brumimicrobium mesophilum]